MAGAPIIIGSQRPSTVSPLKQTPLTSLHPIVRESDASEVKGDEPEAENEDASEEDEADKLKKHVEDLSRRVAQHFEDEHEKQAVSPPLIKAPQQPTREEWEQHQTTHTPYKSWCPHCVAARAVRRKHPSKGRKHEIGGRP